MDISISNGGCIKNHAIQVDGSWFSVYGPWAFRLCAFSLQLLSHSLANILTFDFCPVLQPESQTSGDFHRIKSYNKFQLRNVKTIL